MDGIIPFLKPPGITSHDAVAVCRRILKEKRIGHSGTLDPMAYGVLPMFIGKATRLIEYTDSWDKTYVAEACFGYSTDTEDVTGEIVEQVSEMTAPTWETLQRCVEGFQGTQEQTPSVYSAIKINGKRAYEYAREGIPVTMPSRTITVYSAHVLAYSFPYVTIKISCSSGTYIRSLLRDMGQSLGLPLTMTQLARTEVGPFSTSSCYLGEELLSAVPLAPEMAVQHIPSIQVTSAQALDLKQGKQLSLRQLTVSIQPEALYAAFADDTFIGMCRGTHQSLRAEKILL